MEKKEAKKVVKKPTKKATSTTVKKPTKYAIRKAKAIELYRQGYTVTKIAENLKINRCTFYKWMKDEEFKQVKEDVDNDLVQIAKVGLKKRAEGYKYTETKQIIELGNVIREEIAEKELPPDVGACAFILKTKGGYSEKIDIEHSEKEPISIVVPGAKL